MNKIAIGILTILVLSSCTLNSQIEQKELSEKEIIEKIVEAKGGRARLEKVRTYKSIIKGLNTNSLSTTYRKRPDKLFIKVEFQDEVYTAILNGKSGVVSTAGQYREAIEPLLSSMKSDATIFPELYTKELQIHFSYSGIEKVDGKDMHKVKLSFPDKRHETNYYDRDTWLLYKKSIEIGQEEMFFFDYHEFKGILISTSSQSVRNKDTLYYKIKEIEINPKIDDSMFKID